MKKFISIILLVTLLSTIVGCTKDVSESTYESSDETGEKASAVTETIDETPQEMDKVTFILDWLPNTNHTGIYTAIEKGYFADVNIEVEVIQPPEGGVEALVANGQGDFGVSFQEYITQARTAENPLPVVAVAALIQNNTSGFASLTERGIESPKDFEGKLYGSWGTEIETAFIKTMMEKENADVEQLEVIDIVSWDFLTSITNDVDFQWIYYGWDGIAAIEKGVDISFIKLQDIDERLNFYTPLLFTSEDLIASNPDLVKRFLAATAKGYDFAVANPEEAVKDLLKHAPETDEAIALASQIYLADEFISDSSAWGLMEEEVWATFGEWMFENGVITTEFDAKKAFTNEFLPAGN